MREENAKKLVKIISIINIFLMIIVGILTLISYYNFFSNIAESLPTYVKFSFYLIALLGSIFGIFFWISIFLFKDWARTLLLIGAFLLIISGITNFNLYSIPSIAWAVLLIYLFQFNKSIKRLFVPGI